MAYGPKAQYEPIFYGSYLTLRLAVRGRTSIVLIADNILRAGMAGLVAVQSAMAQRDGGFLELFEAIKKGERFLKRDAYSEEGWEK